MQGDELPNDVMDMMTICAMEQHMLVWYWALGGFLTTRISTETLHAACR